MALADLTYYRQLEDYATAMTSYIAAATGVDPTRIIFASPEVAKRKLKEKIALVSGDPTNGKTVEIDQFVSFFFPFGMPGMADYRQSVQQGIWGGVAAASMAQVWADNIDLHVQVDVWGGPDQHGKAFVFNTRMAMNNYAFKMRRIRVNLRDLIMKDPAHPAEVFDANCWYEIDRHEMVDNSQIEEMFNQGMLFRSTFDFTWFTTFYRTAAGGGQALKNIMHIILMVQNDATGEFEKEWQIDG